MTYATLCRRLYYPLLDRLKQLPFGDALHEALEHERLPLAELRAIQLAKLRATIEHAARTPFYAERFAAAGVSPADVQSLDDLRRIPILTKEEVFNAGERMRSEAYEGRLFHGKTSGSTGIAMRFTIDSLQHAWVDASQARGRRWWGVERGDPMVVLWSRPVEHTLRTELRAWGVNRLRNVVQYDAFKDLDEEKALWIARAIERHRPSIIYGYGSSLGKLAELLRTRGIELAVHPRVVEYTADHMYAPERKTAAEVFGAEVITAYGASECGGVAQQCREGALHVSIDHVVVEYLRTDGAPAAPGETGRLVLTQLHNRAMPLLRYEVGDLGAFLSDEPCACGVTLPRMSLQVGKSVDVIDTSSKRGVSAHVFDYINIHLMKHNVVGIKQFFIEQTATDTFEVAFVKDRVFNERSVDVFVEKMREYLGTQIEVKSRFVTEIPLTSSGKRRYFKKRQGLDREATGS